MGASGGGDDMTCWLHVLHLARMKASCRAEHSTAPPRLITDETQSVKLCLNPQGSFSLYSETESSRKMTATGHSLLFLLFTLYSLLFTLETSKSCALRLTSARETPLSTSRARSPRCKNPIALPSLCDEDI